MLMVLLCSGLTWSTLFSGSSALLRWVSTGSSTEVEGRSSLPAQLFKEAKWSSGSALNATHAQMTLGFRNYDGEQVVIGYEYGDAIRLGSGILRATFGFSVQVMMAVELMSQQAYLFLFFIMYDDTNFYSPLMTKS
jgi:hypothetical protein